MANSHFNHSVVNSRQCNEEEIDREAQFQPNQHLSQPINATMYRSTKGASKARRDQINAEIRNLKEMLPITDADKARLSYLHIMSLACMYTRKSLFFSQGALDDDSNGFMSFHELSELTHELSGFLLLITGDGKLLYLSDNVADHLGHCMVDLVAQSDSVFDIIDPSDHFIMRSNLVPLGTPETDRLFRCRFSTSKLIRRQGAENKLMLVRARCLNPPFPVSTYWTSNPVWVCFCTPLKAKTSNLTLPRSPLLTPPPDRSFLLACFHSQHHKDMRLWDVQDSVSVYLGYDVETLRSRSWYSLLHPRDLSHASAQHCALVSEEGERQVEMVVQVEAKDHSWVWLYMVLQLDNGEYPISCRNYIISESEAWSIRQQLCLEQNQFPEYFGSGETMSSPDQVFTPSSSGLSAQSFDFSAATPGMSSSSEVMPPAGHGPLSSLSSLEEENFSQTHGGQQRWKPPTSHLSFRPSVSSPPTLTEPESDTLTQSISSLLANQSEPLHTTLTKPLPTLKMPQTEQMGEFGCNPPDTPHYASGCFRFGEKLQFNLDPTNAAEPCQKPQSMVTSALRTPFLSCGHPGLLLPAEPFRKLPPTTDIFGGDECDIMTLPVIRGPLYVDMPQRPFHCPPNGLLTSEVSPTQQPCSTFPSVEKEQEREREEISLLAGYIRSLAERFYCDPLLSRETLSSLSSSPTPQSLPQSFPCGVECYSWRGLDPPITQEDISLYEESVILEILIQDLSSFPSSPSLCSSSNSPSHSSSPCSPLTPESYSPPSHFDGKSSIGVHHFCSVQSAQCNCMAAGGAMMAVGAGTIRDREVSPESVMDMDVSLMPPSTTFTDSQEPALSPCALSHPAPTLGLPHAQFLVEELADMVSEFEADASITPSWDNNLSCINSHSTMHSRSFHQGESLRDPTF